MSEKSKIREQELKWLGVDLDDTIATSKYPKFKLGKPINGSKEALDKLTKNGWKVIIYTSRPWNEYDVVERWLIKWSIPFRRIICGKLLPRIFIDDRNIEFDGNWKKALKKVRQKGRLRRL